MTGHGHGLELYRPCLIWYGGGDGSSQVEDDDVDHGEVDSVDADDDCNDVPGVVVLILAQTVPKLGCDSEEYPAFERRLSAARARARACARQAMLAGAHAAGDHA